MKRRLSVLAIGVFAVALMGFSTVTPIKQSLSTTDITIIKGAVYNTDDDRYWEMVTFGMSGGDPEDYSVYVNVLDRRGNLIDVISVSEVHEGREISWYKVDLSRYRISKVFYLEIHFVFRSCEDDLNTFNALSKLAQTDAPVDPEETVLIVKYP
jgi:hypothetical protein